MTKKEVRKMEPNQDTYRIHEVGVKKVIIGIRSASGLPCIVIEPFEHNHEMGFELPKEARMPEENSTILVCHNKEGLLVLKKTVDHLVEKWDELSEKYIATYIEKYGVWKCSYTVTENGDGLIEADNAATPPGKDG